jgi:site-specific recombinase
VNAADPKAGMAERHLWLARLFEWLRHAPAGWPGQADNAAASDADAAADTGAKAADARTGVAGDQTATATSAPAHGRTPLPVLRLKHLINVLDSNPAVRERVAGLWQAFWHEVDAPALLADFGFAHRHSLVSELVERVQARVLPGTPQTNDLASLFMLFARPDDALWVAAIDDHTLARLAQCLPAPGWRERLLQALTILVSAVHASAHAPGLRRRMEPALLVGDPFGQLVRAAGALHAAVLHKPGAAPLCEANYLRAVLATCRRASDSVTAHLQAHGVSADIVLAQDQLVARTVRIEQLLGTLIAPEPAGEWRHLLCSLLVTLGERRGLRALLRQSYSLLARQVAERNAETGEHYITRDRSEYRQMLRRAAGGGLILAGTTFGKLGIVALGLSAFWSGAWLSVNYAASFVLVMLLHWTVATKQPAMTAPALAATLPAGGGQAQTEDIDAFVDRVAQLMRSQAAGVLGNLAVAGPLVLALQWLGRWVWGQPWVGPETAEHLLLQLSLLGPTPLYAAFTGVLLFASSLAAGWAQNRFVLHQLDSAIAWNPRFVALLGAPRAQRWAAWWRSHVSSLAANVSLGLMLGLLPAVLSFFAIPLDVRHVTLSTGQLGAALGALGWGLLLREEFWWCVLGVGATGLLNVIVSFWLAFKVALRSRGVRVLDRSRIATAIQQRLWHAPMSFLLPPRT